VVAAEPSADGRSVLLTTSPLADRQPYRFSVAGVSDRARQPNALVGQAPTVTWDSGLAGWWPLDELPGAAPRDVTGIAGPGVLRGIGHAQAQSAAGLRLAGEGGCVELPNTPALRAAQEGDYTLSIWFEPADLPSGQDRAPNAAYGLLLKAGYHEGLIYDRGGRFALTHWLGGDAGAGVSTKATYAPGRRYHVAAVVSRARGTLALYVDGKLDGQAGFTAGAAPRAYGDERWRIGAGNANPKADYAWTAKGTLRGARIYTRALDAETIVELAREQ